MAIPIINLVNDSSEKKAPKIMRLKLKVNMSSNCGEYFYRDAEFTIKVVEYETMCVVPCGMTDDNKVGFPISHLVFFEVLENG